MRKKFLFVLLILLLIFLVCLYFFYKKSDKEQVKIDYIGQIKEYGENEIIINNDGKLLTYINYPKGNNKVLDKNVENWIKFNLKKYKTESIKKQSELTINYNSYILDNRYVSIEFELFYDNPVYAHPEYVVKTFNYDKSTNKMIKLSNVYSNSIVYNIKKSILKKFNLKDDKKNVNILDNYVFTKKGIKILLGKGVFTPSADGIQNLLIDKKALKKICVIYFNSEERNKNSQKSDININNTKIKAKSLEEIKGKKIIALTFDDGPGAYTDKLLKILKKHNIKATFFILGVQTEKYHNVLKKIAKSGHEIGIHTWNHKQLTRLSDADIENELLSTQDIIYKTTGVTTNMIRAPYGSVDKNVKKIAAKNGMYFVHWSIDSYDWKSRDANKIFDTIYKNKNDGGIILCHDIQKQSVESMDKLITSLTKDGYEFVTITDLFKLRNKKLEPANVYFDAN